MFTSNHQTIRKKNNSCAAKISISTNSPLKFRESHVCRVQTFVISCCFGCLMLCVIILVV